jgi:hypothetical protein
MKNIKRQDHKQILAKVDEILNKSKRKTTERKRKLALDKPNPSKSINRSRSRSHSHSTSKNKKALTPKTKNIKVQKISLKAKNTPINKLTFHKSPKNPKKLDNELELKIKDIEDLISKVNLQQKESQSELAGANADHKNLLFDSSFKEISIDLESHSQGRDQQLTRLTNEFNSLKGNRLRLAKGQRSELEKMEEYRDQLKTKLGLKSKAANELGNDVVKMEVELSKVIFFIRGFLDFEQEEETGRAE